MESQSVSYVLINCFNRPAGLGWVKRTKKERKKEKDLLIIWEQVFSCVRILPQSLKDLMFISVSSALSLQRSSCRLTLPKELPNTGAFSKLFVVLLYFEIVFVQGYLRDMPEEAISSGVFTSILYIITLTFGLYSLTE